MRDLTSTVKDELTQPKVRPRLFIEAHFRNGPLRLWTGLGEKQWNGYTWNAAVPGSASHPALLEISALAETGKVEAVGVTARLTCLPAEFAAMVRDEIVQGKPARIWFGFVDDSNNILGDPFLCQDLEIDAAQMGVGRDTCDVVITAESVAIRLQKAIGFGFGADASLVDDAAVSFAANICDEDIPRSGGGTEKRYTYNGVFDTTIEPGRVLQSMADAMAGWLPILGGKWTPLAGVWRSPVPYLFEEKDFRGPIEFDLLTSKRDRFNAIRGKFVDPNNSFVLTDYPAFNVGDFVTVDGETIYREVDRPGIASPATCQRLGKIDILRERGRACVLPLGLCGFQAVPGDVVRVSHSLLGLVEATFRVWRAELAFDKDDDGPYLAGVRLHVREETAETYAWSTAEEGAHAAAGSVTLPAAAPSALLAPNADPTVAPRVIPERLSRGVGRKGAATEFILASYNGVSTGWQLVGTTTIDIPQGTNTITLDLLAPTPTGSGGIRLATTDNLGIAVYSGGAPASPDVSRTGSGEVTRNVSALAEGTYTLGLFFNVASGTVSDLNNGRVRQDTYQYLQSSKVT